MRVRVFAAARAASIRIDWTWVLPLRWRPLRRLPADSLLPGANPVQAARWAAVGNRAMSTPISEMTTVAARSPTPGMVIRSCACAVNGSTSPGVGFFPATLLGQLGLVPGEVPHRPDLLRR